MNDAVCSKQDSLRMLAEIEQLRSVIRRTNEALRDRQRSYPERVNKASVIVGIPLGSCICGISDLASLSCPRHGLDKRQTLEGSRRENGGKRDEHYAIAFGPQEF